MGMFSSLGDFWDSLKDIGEQEAQSRLDTRFQGDHIAAQNDAVAEMSRLLQTFNAGKPRTDSQYFNFENDVLNIADRFHRYAMRINSARANRGDAEVNTLAKQIVDDAEAERMGSGRPVGYGTTGSAIFSGLSEFPGWLVGGVAALGLSYLLKKRGR